MQIAAISPASTFLGNGLQTRGQTSVAAEISPLEKRLAGATDKTLREALFRQLIKENLLGVLSASAELSRRGIAPIFQLRYPFGWLEPLAHGRTRLSVGQIFRLETTGCVMSSEMPSLPSNVEFILLCIDLQWVTMQYPKHKPEWLRASGIFKKTDFLKTAKYLFWGGRREPGQLSKALALNPSQQRECCVIKCLNESRWQERLVIRLHKAVEKIDAHAERSRDYRTDDERHKTLIRRRDLWLCAEMADWKPQRTADFYRMISGAVLQRNNVAKQMAKLPKVHRSD